MHHVSLV